MVLVKRTAPKQIISYDGYASGFDFETNTFISNGNWRPTGSYFQLYLQNRETMGFTITCIKPCTVKLYGYDEYKKDYTLTTVGQVVSDTISSARAWIAY